MYVQYSIHDNGKCTCTCMFIQCFKAALLFLSSLLLSLSPPLPLPPSFSLSIPLLPPSLLQECGKSEYCKTAGLHAHHPRDCLYYLRDFGVTELQELLTNNDVNFDIGMVCNYVTYTGAQYSKVRKKNSKVIVHGFVKKIGFRGRK